VVLNNGQVHYFNSIIRNSYYKKQSESFTIKGHKIQSISSGYFHTIMVTMKGAVFGFGYNSNHQLGVVDPSALSGDTVSTPTEVFAAITKSKRT
jgi:alpha-tubulin suppressor-like RCC1 family protein